MGAKKAVGGRQKNAKLVVAVIGLGNLGMSLAKAIARTGTYTVRGFDRNVPKRRELGKVRGALSVKNISKAIDGVKLILICVKPGDVEAVSREIGKVLGSAQSEPVIVSTAAAVPVSSIQNAIGGQHPCSIVRVMPNLLIEVAAGTVGIFGKDEAAKALVRDLFSPFAQVQNVPKESMMHAVTAIVGSGPALIVELMRAFKDAMVQAGTPHHDALAFTIAIFQGTASWVRARSDVHPAALIDAITSPGGTTAQLMFRARSGGIHPAIQAAIMAAAERSEQIAAALANKS